MASPPLGLALHFLNPASTTAVSYLAPKMHKSDKKALRCLGFFQYTSLDFSGGKRHLEGLAAALRKNSRDNLVVVATTDYGYVEMTLNLYETSFER